MSDSCPAAGIDMPMYFDLFTIDRRWSMTDLNDRARRGFLKTAAVLGGTSALGALSGPAEAQGRRRA